MTSPSDDSTPTVAVDLDLDIYDYLKARSTFEDTVSSVLRRELKLHGKRSVPAAQPSTGEFVDAVVHGPSRPATPPRSAHRVPSRQRRKSSARTKRSRAAAGTLLPELVYHRPILEILVDKGGRAPKQQVIDEVGRRLEGRLTEQDKSPLESGGIRWESRAQFARLRLAQRGLMDKNAPRGVWAITPEGIKALEEETV
jgi:hypothetical protein